ncbi:carbohydrate ABC transporter permease [Marinicrinis lubricantis]|uniref:Carbohydrate ABC transporter permease n=1 Tax=Marinicrinis lubricantis TaxID=2086470 RepID=A0ABW1IJQ3_9BACL
MGAKRNVLLYLSPAILFTAVFFIFPFIFLVIVSLQEWDGLSAMTFVGLDNFRTLFADPVFKKAIINTLVWIFSAIFLHMPLGLGLALILHRRPRGWKFFRTLFFLPNVISTTALAFLWYFVLHVNLGLVNSVLKLVGLESLTRPWLSDLGTALMANQLPFILYVGFTMVIFLTQMSTISPDLYEAAELDGATSWQKDRFITIPLVKNAIAINVIFNVAFCLRMFEYPFLMTGGGPANSTMNMSLYIYKEMITANRYGVSMAAGLLTIALGILVMGTVLRVIRASDRK